MTEASFDPTGAVRFDLPRGAVHGHGEAALLVPQSALAALTDEVSEAVSSRFGAAIGNGVGRAVRASLGEPTQAPADVFTTHFAGALAVLGCGAVSVERWGRAMMVVVERPALSRAVLAATIRSALETATGRALDTVVLDHSDGVSRHLIVNLETAATVRAWLEEGVGWGAVIERLHGAEAHL